MRRFLGLPTALALLPMLLGLAPGSAPRAAAAPGDRPVFEKILVTIPTFEQAKTVMKQIPDIEFLKPTGDEGVYVAVSTPEIDRQLEALGYPVTVVVPDMEAEFQSRATGPGFGAFHTYSETIAALDSLAALYPGIMTAKFSIGRSLEDRDMWAVKISDNPNTDEDEPEVLFDGVTHAREIMTVEMVLHYINYLLSNYGSDPTATFLVNNREIYFVPIVNPDGFVYNESTNPNGGGLWRKNRRNNGGGCIGVDINRNYELGWGGINGSPDPCNEQYRGTAPNSEPETQVMQAFIDSRNFATHQSFHSFAELVLLPWGYDDTVHTPDDAILRDIGADMARDSGYLVGQAGEVLYNAAGNAFDWSYGATTNHSKIFAFSIEIGGSNFWPAESEMPGLLAENLHAHIVLTQLAGPSLEIVGSAVLGGDANGRLDPGESAGVSISARNSAAGPLSGTVVTLSSDDAYVQLGSAQKSMGSFAGGETKNLAADPFAVTVDPSCPVGHPIAFTVTFTGDGGYLSSETLTLTAGVLPLLYAQNFETGNDWTQDPAHTATTGAWVRIDPNATNYQPGNDATPDPGAFALITGQNSSDGVDDVDGGVSAARSPVIDLSAAPGARLDLSWTHGQRDTGGDAGDLFRIDLSSDGGASYPVTLLSWGDAAHAPGWTPLSVRLDSVATLTSTMRLRVRAADGLAVGEIIEGGIDEVRISAPASANAAPGAPVAVSPTGGATTGAAPTLTVTNAADPESNPLVYGFRVYSDALLTTLVASADGIAEGAGTTSWTVNPSLAAGNYWWRAFAADPEVRGLYSSPAAAFEAQTSVVGLEAGAAVVRGVALTMEGPNPSRGATRVAFELPRPGRVFIAVVNLEGRVVRILESGWRDAGRHEAVWDGRDAAGREAASGAYLIRLEAGADRRTERVTLLR